MSEEDEENCQGENRDQDDGSDQPLPLLRAASCFERRKSRLAPFLQARQLPLVACLRPPRLEVTGVSPPAISRHDRER
jgi:hypothetical protein